MTKMQEAWEEFLIHTPPSSLTPKAEIYEAGWNDCLAAVKAGGAALAGIEPVAWMRIDEEEDITFYVGATDPFSGEVIETGWIVGPLYSAATVERLVQDRNELAKHVHEAVRQRNDAREQLAASQAREQQMREALIEISTQRPEKPDHWSSCGQCDRNIDNAQDLVALPQDDTALNAWGAKLLDEMAGQPDMNSHTRGVLLRKADELDVGK